MLKQYFGAKIVIFELDPQKDIFTQHTVRKVKFLSKNSILTKPQPFHEFFTQIFFDNFSREIKVVNSKKVQNHNIFTTFSSKKIDNFLRKSKSSFWTKNKDFVCSGQKASFSPNGTSISLTINSMLLYYYSSPSEVSRVKR